jgi:hypothetical protein
MSILPNHIMEKIHENEKDMKDVYDKSGGIDINIPKPLTKKEKDRLHILAKEMIGELSGNKTDQEKPNDQ